MQPRLILIFAVLLAGFRPAAEAAGAIGGSVIDAASSKPVYGVHILAMRVREELNVRTALPYRAVTDRQGRFSMDAVEDGRYEVCVTALGGYLDSCSWGAPVSVQVPSTAEVRIQLQRGVPLNVDFADDKRLLDQFEGRRVEGLPSVEITGPDGKRRVLSRTQGWRFTELVPPDVPFTVTVRSRLLSLSDEAGSPISAAPGYQVQVRVPQSPPPMPRMFSRGAGAGEFRVLFRVLSVSEQPK